MRNAIILTTILSEKGLIVLDWRWRLRTKIGRKLRRNCSKTKLSSETPRSVELGKHLFRTLRFQILRVLHQSKDSIETSLFCRSRAVVSSFYLSRYVFPTLSLNLVYFYFFLSVFLFDTRLLTQ